MNVLPRGTIKDECATEEGMGSTIKDEWGWTKRHNQG